MPPQVPGMPPMPGMPMPGMPGMPGAGPGAPGGGDPFAANPDLALGAMMDLTPKSGNPTQAITKVSKALDQMHKLAMLILPQVSQWNSKLAKDIHALSKQILTAKLDLTKEQQPGPPPDLMLGLQDSVGLPPAMGAGQGGSQPSAPGY